MPLVSTPHPSPELWDLSRGQVNSSYSMEYNVGFCLITSKENFPSGYRYRNKRSQTINSSLNFRWSWNARFVLPELRQWNTYSSIACQALLLFRERWNFTSVFRGVGPVRHRFVKIPERRVWIWPLCAMIFREMPRLYLQPWSPGDSSEHMLWISGHAPFPQTAGASETSFRTTGGHSILLPPLYSPLDARWRHVDCSVSQITSVFSRLGAVGRTNV